MRNCLHCGKAFLPNRGQLYCSPECLTAENNKKSYERTAVHGRKPPYKFITCSDCGSVVWAHIHSTRCYACQRARNLKLATEYKQRSASGKSRKMGAEYPCERCGKPYILESGMQKYCKDCTMEARKENAKAKAKRAWDAMTKEERRYTARNRTLAPEKPSTICPVCGKAFTVNKYARVFCSKACAAESARQKDRARAAIKRAAKKETV